MLMDLAMLAEKEGLSETRQILTNAMVGVSLANDGNSVPNAAYENVINFSTHQASASILP